MKKIDLEMDLLIIFFWLADIQCRLQKKICGILPLVLVIALVSTTLASMKVCLSTLLSCAVDNEYSYDNCCAIFLSAFYIWRTELDEFYFYRALVPDHFFFPFSAVTRNGCSN